MTLILGIESSCDETAASVVEDGVSVRSNVIASQHELHERYRGVVPEIASRAHLEKISPVVDEALIEAGVTFDEIDAVAVGNRPGLIGSLLVGLSAAKAIAWLTNKPLIGVNHIKAHLYAGTLAMGDAAEQKKPEYPALGLVVSGGHSSLYKMASPTETELLGKTIDDAVGEAYDKAAVILDIPYPGGPNLDKMARNGNPKAYDLPRSMLKPGSLDFSFSGLKTALLYTVKGHPRGRGEEATYQRSISDFNDQQRADLAASFQAAAIDALIKKIERAIKAMDEQGGRPRALVVGGGVSANSHLRERALKLGEKHDIDIFLPAMKVCLDNAAMIAGLAYHHYTAGEFDGMDLPAIATTGK